MLLDIEREAIKILMERNLNAGVQEINMAEKYPGIRGLKESMAKMRAALNEAATGLQSEVEQSTKDGVAAIGTTRREVNEAKSAIAELKEFVEGETNGGPL